jgi:hypothetical protein
MTSGAEHHPDCDGSCRNCPIEVPVQCPCETCGGDGVVHEEVPDADGENKCTWTEEYIVCGEPTGCWSTSCGHEYVINEGTPSENQMKFCTFCGKEIREETDGTE